MDKNQPTALITGSARRIGAAIATYLHQLGFRVIIHCHNSYDEASALVDLLNAKKSNSSKLLSSDLNSIDAANKLINDTITWSNGLDVLINNASIFSRDEDCSDNMFLVNVKIPFWLSNSAYPHLCKTNGCIINITDTHANAPLSGYSMYCQTKAALSMQTKSLAQKFAPDVRVNAVAPGAILWPEGENSLSMVERKTIISKTPLKRHGSPVYIAKAVFSLIDNDFITGQELKVDGGRNL
jgi:pteridine reductase